MDTIAAYLARRDVAALTPAAAPDVDVLVLCGSAVLASIDVAAAAFHAGVADRVLVTGGIGHSTAHLQRAVQLEPRYRGLPTEQRAEAAIIAEILRTHHDVPDDALLTEERSTNCGDNARFSVDLLDAAPWPALSLLLVQDPTMQRRTHASFRRSLRGRDTRLRSFAPFVPAWPHDDDGQASEPQVRDPGGRAVWSANRFTALVLGEVLRLRDDEHGYGPRGADFIDHVDLPPDVLRAFGRLVEAQPGQVREAWRPG